MVEKTAYAPSPSPDGAACPVETAIRTIGGKWRLLIIRMLLLEGPHRFNRLLEAVDGISSKVLSQDLRALGEAGIVARRVISERPQQVEYALTPAGGELLPIFQALGGWGERLAAAETGAAAPYQA